MSEEQFHLFHLTCTSCGAPLRVTQDYIDDDFIKCEYCGTEYSLHGKNKEIKTEETYNSDDYSQSDETTLYSSNTTLWSSGVVTILTMPIIGAIIIALVFLNVFSFIINGDKNIINGTTLTTTLTNSTTTTTINILNESLPMINWVQPLIILFPIFVIILLAIFIFKNIR